jgi:DNA-binding NtrC family response regulator
MTVLSVSPSQSDHRFLEASAGACHCQLVQAVGLIDALAVLNRCEVNVVVYDHDSPSGNWREMLQYLQESSNPAALIITSRLADERLWAEALNLGAWDVLAKPFDRSEVTRSIEWACQHAAYAAGRAAITNCQKANSSC